mgnify:CR=1 FL=1
MTIKYLPILLLISAIHSQDVNQTSKIKSSTFRGTPCDDTEYRNSNGTPNWKNYGRFLSECDSLSTTYFDAEFAEMDRVKQREQATKDSLEQIEIASMDIDVFVELKQKMKHWLFYIIDEVCVVSQ